MSKTHQMRVVVCEDDPVVRSVVSGLVEQASGEVLAETDSALEAMQLIERFEPDLVILDLNLHRGSGIDVLDRVRELSAAPHVIVFTAYDTPGRLDGDAFDVVPKPDFELLGERLAGWSARSDDRRRNPVREVAAPVRPGVEDSTDFYRLLAEARPGDALVHIEVGSDQAGDLAATVRRAVRAQDRVLRRSDGVLVLLIGGGAVAVEALCQRLLGAVPDIADRTRSADVGEDPTATFAALTAG